MDSQDTQVLDAAQRWAAAGHRFALVTVARTWGSAPRPPGAWMALRDDGQVETETFRALMRRPFCAVTRCKNETTLS